MLDLYRLDITASLMSKLCKECLLYIPVLTYIQRRQSLEVITSVASTIAVSYDEFQCCEKARWCVV